MICYDYGDFIDLTNKTVVYLCFTKLRYPSWALVSCFSKMTTICWGLPVEDISNCSSNRYVFLSHIYPIRFIRWVNHQLSHSYPSLGEKQPWKRIFQQFIIYVVNLSPISTMKQPVIFWAFGFPCRYPSFKCGGDFWIFNTMVTAPWCRSQMGL